MSRPLLVPDPVDFGFGPVKFPTDRRTITDYFPKGTDDGTLQLTPELAYNLAGSIPIKVLKDWLLFGANQYRIEIDLNDPFPDQERWKVHVIGVWNRLVLMHNIFLEPHLPRDSIWKEVFEVYEKHQMVLRGTWEGSSQQRDERIREEERARIQRLRGDKPVIETPEFRAYANAVKEAVAKGEKPPPLPPLSTFGLNEKPGPKPSSKPKAKRVLSPEQRAVQTHAQRLKRAQERRQKKGGE